MHTTGLPPAQTPDWHVSTCVQALLSLHAVPVRSEQVPFTAAPAATEQASQAPAPQRVLQHTPSAQNPLWQKAALAHGSPLDPENRSALESCETLRPAATTTRPLVSVVAVWKPRGVVRAPAEDQVFVAGV